MKEKIKKIVEELISKTTDCEYNLTLNFKQQTPIFGLPFNSGSLHTIQNYLDVIVDVESFNLTLSYENNDSSSDITNPSHNRWYHCKIIFYGGNDIIDYDLNFLSNLTNFNDTHRYVNTNVNLDKIDMIILDLLSLKDELINQNNELFDKFNKMNYD